MNMSREAEQQIVKPIRSLPWYMFLVPPLFTLLILLFEPSALTDTRPEYGYWAMMWTLRNSASLSGFCANCFVTPCSVG